MALTQAKIQTHISNLVFALENLRLYAGVNAENFLLHWAEAGKQVDYPGDFEFGGASKRALDVLRSQLAATISQAPQTLLNGFLDYGKLNDAAAVKSPFPEREIPTIFRRLRDHFIAQSLTIKARNFTFGTPAAGGSNSGNGAIRRLNQDRDGTNLENQFPEDKIAECVQDAHSGAAKHEEVFEFRGEATEIDLLKIIGSGISDQRIKALSAQDSLQFLQNPSFESLDGTITTLVSIPGWTRDTGAIGDYQLSEAEFYRGFQSDGGTPRSLLLKDNAAVGHKISQAFTLRGANFDVDKPLFFHVAFKRNVAGGTTAGTLTIRLGAKTNSVVLAAQTGWQVLEIPISGIDESWYDNINEQSLNVEIELSAAANGDLAIDDIVLAPMENFGGGWYAVVGGQTPFLRDDIFNWADTVSGEGILAHWFWRAFNEYLPATTGVATWLDPT